MGLLDTLTNTLKPSKTARNTLFRRRRVQFFLQQLENGSFVTTDSVELAEVTSIKERILGDTGVAKGSVTPVIQPWYLSPVTIELSGKSYMGAFSDPKFNATSTDLDIELLMRMRDRVNTAFLKVSEASDFRVLMTYGTAQSGAESVNRGVGQTLVGFIGEISTDESDDKPYIKTYTVRFTGELQDTVSVRDGQTRQRTDAAQINNLKTPSIK